MYIKINSGSVAVWQWQCGKVAVSKTVAATVAVAVAAAVAVSKQ
jgi:hypothetical protein